MVDTAVKFGILPHVTFNTTVVETEWLEEEGRWRSLTSGGEEYYSQVLVHATGMLHHPAYPGLAGQQDFTGQTLHTARWDQDINLTDKVGHQYSSPQISDNYTCWRQLCSVRTPLWMRIQS